MLLAFSQIFGQKVDPKNAALAEKYKLQYPLQKDISMRSTDEYTFELNKFNSSAPPVSAIQRSSSDILSLSEEHEYEGALFYDFQSEISSVREHKGNSSHSLPTYKDQTSGEGIFFDDLVKLRFYIEFTKRGDRKRYEYTKRYNDVKYLVSAYFHQDIAVQERVIKFQIPDWLAVELKEMNFEGYDIEKTVVADPKKKITTYTYTAKHLLPFKKESNSPSAARSYPHILILCKSYHNSSGTASLFDSVDALYKWYSGLCKEVKDDNSELKPVVEKLLEGKKNDLEKVEAIYYWVQENIRYIAFEDGIMGFKPQEAQKVFSNRYGDCKGKANLLKQMLVLAGYDARLTWLGTSDLPYDYSIPSLAVDNHMICTLFLNGKKYFLDGTEEYISINDNADRIQGKQVLIEDGDKYILDTVPLTGPERNKIESVINLSLTGDVLYGSYSSTYNGQQKVNILRGYAAIQTDKKEDAMKRFLAGENKNLKVSNVSTSDLSNRQAPLKISYDLKLHNQVTTSGDEMYVIVDMDKELADYEFDSTRVNDYEFNHKMTIETKTIVDIPTGYKVDYLPDSVVKKYDNYSFELSYKMEGDKIIYNKRIVIANAIISKKDFTTWNACVKAVRRFYHDPVIFVKN